MVKILDSKVLLNVPYHKTNLKNNFMCEAKNRPHTWRPKLPIESFSEHGHVSFYNKSFIYEYIKSPEEGTFSHLPHKIGKKVSLKTYVRFLNTIFFQSYMIDGKKSPLQGF